MGDEAVLRIVLDDASGSGSGGGTAPVATPSPIATPNPIAPPATVPPPRPSSEPVPVKIAKPPPPVPPPAAPPAPPVDWMKSLINPTEGVNPHVLLEGQSGSGKSLAAKHIAFERMKQGQVVNVVDTHTPEAWGGVKESGGQVFQGATAGLDAAKFLKDALESRKIEATEAKLRGEQPDFKPMTVVFSDFARLMKDTPQLGVEFATLLTEARKFRISIVADTTALTGAASGIKGIQDVRNNFGQQVKFNAPTAQGDPRRAEVGGETYDTPQLPDYKERIDYSLVQPAKPPDPPPPPEVQEPFDPVAAAKKRVEAEERRVLVDAEYAKLKPPKVEPVKSAFDALLDAAESLRGILGGTFGRVLGAALDVTAKLRDMRTKAAQVALLGVGAGIPAPTATVAPLAPTAVPVESREPFVSVVPTPATDVVQTTQDTPTAQVVPTAQPPKMAEVAPIPEAEEVAPPLSKEGSSGAMAGIARAAPYIAIGLLVDQVVKGAVKGVIGGVGSLAKGVSSPNDDASNSMMAMSSAISGLGQVIPVIGIPLVVVGEGLKVVAGLMDNFTKIAEKYSEYNPMIAQAQAMADMKKIMGDMRRAQESGPELARFLRSQAELQQRFEDIKMKIWMKILPILTAIMEAVSQLLNIAESNQDFDVKDPTDFILDKAEVAKVRSGATIPLSTPADVLEIPR